MQIGSLFTLSIVGFILISSKSFGQVEASTTDKPEYRTKLDIPYVLGDDLTDYAKERCRLDVYHPSKAGFATVV